MKTYKKNYFPVKITIMSDTQQFQIIYTNNAKNNLFNLAETNEIIINFKYVFHFQYNTFTLSDYRFKYNPILIINFTYASASIINNI